MCIILYQGHRWAGCSWLTCLQAGSCTLAQRHLWVVPLPPPPSPSPNPYSSLQTKASLSQTCTWQCQSLLNLLPRPRDSPGGQGLFPWPSLCTWRLLFLLMLGPKLHTSPFCCFALTFSCPLTHCANCTMGLNSQMASSMTLPTPFTLLAPQEQPGQRLRDRRPWMPCWYQVCSMYSLFFQDLRMD